MGLLDSIKKTLTNIKPDVKGSEVTYTPEEVDASGLRRERLKAIGKTKGRYSRAKREKEQLRRENERLKKLLEGETFAEKVEGKRKELTGLRREDILFLDEIPRNTMVFGKFNRPLGYFYSFFLDSDTGRTGIALTSEPKGDNPYTSRAWLFDSFSEFFHHPENLALSLQGKALILNITHEGDFVPDLDTVVPASDVPLE